MDKNRFALTPPMGWNSWDCYGNAVNEEQLKQNADFMAAHLKEFGWEYIVCDIEWAEPLATGGDYSNFADLCMDEYGRLIPAENRFPSAANGAGFKPIADYVHSKGLKFGIHCMRGIPRMAVANNLKVKGTPYTARQVANPSSVCSWNSGMYGLFPDTPGSQEYVDSLLELYASWGVDYLKVDDICVIYGVAGDESTIRHGGKEFAMWNRAIEKCGRDMVLSLSPGPAMVSEAADLCKYANMWRITNDFWDEWRLLENMFERCDQWAPYVKEGCWPDCDMLPMGRLNYKMVDGVMESRPTNFTLEELRTMMNLWCIFRSPLMIGSELSALPEDQLALLTNQDVLALLKNSRNAHQFKRAGNLIGWIADDAETEDKYLAVFCTSGWEAFNYVFYKDEMELEGDYELIDLWTGESQGLLGRGLTLKLAPHQSRLYRLIKR